jgi:hypothetical protein
VVAVITLTRSVQPFAVSARAALRKVEAGQHSWLDAPDRDSCHLVWIQFHEDLLATLGLPRGSDN